MPRRVSVERGWWMTEPTHAIAYTGLFPNAAIKAYTLPNAQGTES